MQAHNSINKYDGVSTPFTDFMSQFNTVSALNGWSDQTKAIIVANYLTGPALNFYQTIYESSSTYEEIIKALADEFSHDCDCAAQFYSTRQNQDEKTIEYLYRMTLLAKKANITSEPIIIKQILSTLTFYNKRKYATQIFNSIADFRKVAKQEYEIFNPQSQQLALPTKIQSLGCTDPCLQTCSRGDGTQNAPSAHSYRQFSERVVPTDVYSTPVTTRTPRVPPPISMRTPHVPPPSIRPMGPTFSAGRGTSVPTADRRPPFQQSAGRGTSMPTQQPQHGYDLRSRQRPSQDVRQEHPNTRRR